MSERFWLVLSFILISFSVQAADADIYRQAYEFALEAYVEPLSAEQLSVKSLQGLH